MFAPERKKMDPKDYEKVVVNDLLPTVIEEIQYEPDHTFKGFKGAPDTVGVAVRFKLQIEGMKFHKYTRWMKFMMGEKSNLFTKYLAPLVDGIEPDSKFDLDHLKGMKIKTLWKENGDFQNLEIIIPHASKIPYTDQPFSDSPPF